MVSLSSSRRFLAAPEGNSSFWGNYVTLSGERGVSSSTSEDILEMSVNKKPLKFLYCVSEVSERFSGSVHLTFVGGQTGPSRAVQPKRQWEVSPASGLSATGSS